MPLINIERAYFQISEAGRRLPGAEPNDIASLIEHLQTSKIGAHKRRVPVGDLLTERDQNAKQYGFGAGTTMYDSTLVLGNVKVGENCWIGPNVVLDGSGGLEIGDDVCVSAGVHIYTHDSSERFIGSGCADPRKSNKIGSNVYIGPHAVIAMGVTIGDRVKIGAMSFVNKDVPSDCVAFGQPARVRRPT